MKIFNRLMVFCRFIPILFKYKPKYYIRTKGKVHFENKNITFGKNVNILDGVQFRGSGKITIGDNVDIGSNTIIYSNEDIYIGSDTMIAAQCYIIDCDHGTSLGVPMRYQQLVSKKIEIGNDVWIGAGAKILKGSIISDGCVIAAQSVVNRNTKTEKNTIYGGIPAKVIKKRS